MCAGRFFKMELHCKPGFSGRNLILVLGLWTNAARIGLPQGLITGNEPWTNRADAGTS